MIRPSTQMSTALLRAANPTLAALPVALTRVPVGIDVYSGAPFRYDPFEAYQTDLVTDPVMCVIGSKGSGKSSLSKSLSVRFAGVGHKVRYIDPKGETAPLARFFGEKPVRPGDVTINPLDAARGNVEAMSEIAAAVIAAAINRPLTQVEILAVSQAARTAAGRRTVPTLRAVGETLAEPALVDSLPVDVTSTALTDLVAAVTNLAGLEAGRMFLDESTVHIDPATPFVSFDLSGHSEDTTRILMVVVASYLAEQWRRPQAQSVVVLDEMWRLIRHLPTAIWLQSAFKLARAYGAAFIPVLQHLSDLKSAGDKGSQTYSIAAGLLSDAEVRVVYRQPAGEREALSELLGLTEEEITAVGKLRRGEALWKLRDRSMVVRHLLTDAEWPMIDTDAELGGRRRR